MRPRVRYVAALVAGAGLVGHAFLYEGLLTEAGLVSFLDPVGAISPLPYGAYHVGIGVAYVAIAAVALQWAERSLPIRELLLVIVGAFLASCIGIVAFWSTSPAAIRWWEWSFVLATAQVTLIPLRGVSAVANGDREQRHLVPHAGLNRLFWVGSFLPFVPLFSYGLVGVTAGGWGVLNAATVAVVLLLNTVVGYPLYRLGRGFPVTE